MLGRDSIPAKITIIEMPSRKEESPCFRGGCVSYGTNCAPFLGRDGKGYESWLECLEEAWGLVEEGGGWGGGGAGGRTIGADKWLHFSITQLPSSASPMPFWPINIATHLPQIGQRIAVLGETL